MELIEPWRREHKWSARRIHRYLLDRAVTISLRTVGRWLHRLGIFRLRHFAPDGNALWHPPRRIRAARLGHMVQLGRGKIGRSPDGGGWGAHGRGIATAKAAKRGSGVQVGYTYLHSALDGFSQLAYTEALDDERAPTTIGFICRARAFFTAHGISKMHQAVTDNGANYRAQEYTLSVEALTSRHQRIRPYTPRHNGEGRSIQSASCRGSALRQ